MKPWTEQATANERSAVAIPERNAVAVLEPEAVAIPADGIPDGFHCRAVTARRCAGPTDGRNNRGEHGFRFRVAYMMMPILY
jgi:hypothetical protein